MFDFYFPLQLFTWILFQLDIKNVFLHDDLDEKSLNGATSLICCSGKVI